VKGGSIPRNMQRKMEVWGVNISKIGTNPGESLEEGPKLGGGEGQKTKLGYDGMWRAIMTIIRGGLEKRTRREGASPQT